MKKLLLGIPVLLIALAACGLSAQEKLTSTASYTTATAKQAFVDAEKLIKQRYPEAFLVGFNNYDNTFERTNAYPAENQRDKSAQIPFWAFMFARSKADVTDGVLSDSEAVAVNFSAGTFTLIDVGGVKALDLSVDSDACASQWQTNNDAALAGTVAKIKEEFGEEPKIDHLDFNMSPKWGKPCGYELTVWTSAKAGYDAKVDAVTGEIGYTRPISVN